MKLKMLVIGIATATVMALAATPAGAAAPVNYVALGDSYSSGLGSGGDSGGGCERSAGAFSALWAAAHAPASYVSVACAGATTASVTSGQLSALSASTSLISITVGGNDIGFTAIMTTCALKGTSACVAAVNTAEATTNGALPGRLDNTYAQIATRAPQAKVVVLGYPLFYQLHVWYCVGLSETSRAKIDEGINLVDDVIAAAAARHGFTFADVRGAFGGHQLCSGSKWLHAVDLSDIEESYHPTATGQRSGYLPVFTAAA